MAEKSSGPTFQVATPRIAYFLAEMERMLARRAPLSLIKVPGMWKATTSGLATGSIGVKSLNSWEIPNRDLAGLPSGNPG